MGVLSMSVLMKCKGLFRERKCVFFLISFCKGTLIKIGWWIIWCVQETDSFNLSKLSRPIKYSKNCKNQTTNLCCSFPDCAVLCPPSVHSTIVASSGAEWVKKNTYTHKTTHRLFRLVQVIQWTTQEEKKTLHTPLSVLGKWSLLCFLFLRFLEVCFGVFPHLNRGSEDRGCCKLYRL